MTSVRGKKAAKLSSQQIHDYCAQMEAISKAQPVSAYDMNGIILDINENFEKLLGYSRADVIGKHVSIFVDERERQTPQYHAAVKQLWERLARGEACEGEAKRISKQGSEVWIHYSYNPVFDGAGKPCKVINYFNDVTRQKLASADKAGQITAIGKALAVIEFQMDGTILTANDNFLNTVGYTLDEIKGKHHSMFVEEAYRQSPAYKEFWAKLGRGEYDAGEFKRIGKGGREVWLQASYNPILDLNGRPLKVVKYATDITRQKMALEAMMADAMMLSQAAVEGRLATRADISKHQGDYRTVVEGVNQTLDAVIGPLNVAADYVDKISKGNVPPKITDNYNGDFNTIKKNLN
ncbi:MAG TPA: PAS domain S-box protein, partial [Candidatus Binatia bacterium]|nr:PAS domain S-box protein [Candidatus Binatia bacterium]